MQDVCGAETWEVAAPPDSPFHWILSVYYLGFSIKSYDSSVASDFINLKFNFETDARQFLGFRWR